MVTLETLEEGRYYKIKDLQAILKSLGLLYSIFTVRDYESYKCVDYHCGKRHDYPVEKCGKCGGEVRAPLIPSPRTRGGSKGKGHRRYTVSEIQQIVNVFKQRV